jgi:predicted enzyme related to lactoylglutathione lyase
MTAHHSHFVWYELMTSDAAAAEAFYRQVIGWSTADAGMPGVAYTLLSAGATVVAGLMALPQAACDAGARPGWTGYVSVDDVDAMAARLQQAGGKVHRPPEDIPGVGRFATVADPHGAVFCLFKGVPEEQPLQPPVGTSGTIGWHELYAGDLDSAWAFYSALFGWAKDQAIDMGPMGTYQLFAASPGSPAIGGMMTRPPQVPQPCWLYYVAVEAIDAAAARITAAGGQVVSGPMEVPGGSWIVQGLDPQGAMFAMVAPKR